MCSLDGIQSVSRCDGAAIATYRDTSTDLILIDNSEGQYHASFMHYTVEG